MAESSVRDIKVGFSKSILEQSEMDLTNLRIGKQRVVSKKKRMSKLKKTILEDREYRDPERPTGVATAAAGPQRAAPRPVGLVTTPSEPEPFLPSWCQMGVEEVEKDEMEEMQEEEEAECSAEPPNEDVAELSEDVADVADAELEALSISEALERLKEVQGRGGASAATKPKTDLEVRHYVHQELSDELDEKVKHVLSELVRFQERAKENPVKYAKLKRYCVGLREAKRAINRNKCKGLIVAPNLEVSTAEGGLDDTVEDLVELARENEVPVIFALSRNRIGKAMGKNIRLSIVALHSVDGVHQQFKELLKLADELRRRWVLRQMSHATSEYAEQALKRAEEKALRDAERRAEKERLEVAKAAEELQRAEERKKLKAEKAEMKARKVALQQEEAERRREEREAQAKEREVEKAREDQEMEAQRVKERLAEQERLRKEEEAAKEAERRRRAELRRAEEERQKRMAEAAAKVASTGPVKADESDAESSGSDLPLGFNSNLF